MNSRFKSHEDFKKDGDARANWPRLTEENFAKNYKIVEVSFRDQGHLANLEPISMAC